MDIQDQQGNGNSYDSITEGFKATCITTIVA